MRTVSVSFQVYLSNKIGATAMGVFSLISTVYGFALTLGTSGIQLATTKLISEALGTDGGDRNRHIRSLLNRCIGYALFFGALSSCLLFSLSSFIGVHLLGDERTVLPLRILSVTLIPIALSSVFNGYFTAVRRVWKNATVQVLGEGIRIFSCISLLALCLPGDVQFACLSVILGGTIAELSSFLIHGSFFLYERRKARSASQSAYDEKKQSGLLKIALPVAFSAYVRSALVTIEHLLIPRGLEKSGSSRDASLAAYGTLHSMVFPLVLFPAALSSSFAGLLVPEISEANARGDRESIIKTVERVFEAVLTYAIGVSGILICFSQELGGAIYPKTDAAKFILFVAPLVPVMYLDTSVDSILKGLGQQIYHMGINIADSFLSVILVIILLPRFGIMGYVMTVYFTELINAALSIARLFSVIKIRPKLIPWVVRPLFCVIISTSATKIFIEYFGRFSTETLEVAFHIILATALYLLLTIVFKRSKKTKDN
jgi:stage V sporulation protein B